MGQIADRDANSHEQTSTAEKVDDSDAKADEFESEPRKPSELETTVMDDEKVEIEKINLRKSAEEKCDVADAQAAEAQAKPLTRFIGSMNIADDEKESIASEESESVDDRTEELQQSVRRIDEKLKNWESQLLVAGVLDTFPEVEMKAEQKKGSPAIPEVLYVDWQGFKHKIEGEKKYAVEVLKGPAKYYYEREEEEKKHRAQMEQLKRGSGDVPEGNANLLLDVENSEELPERIRINSMPILAILSNIDSAEKWNLQSVVILRPFKPLVYYDFQIRNTLKTLEAEWGETEKEARLRSPKGTPAASTNPINREEDESEIMAESDSSAYETLSNPSSEDHPNEDSLERERPDKIKEHVEQENSADEEYTEEGEDHPTKDEPEDIANSIEALRDLRCLADFMDKHLYPVVAQYRSNDRQTVSFNDLWHLFKPGDLIYGPLGSRTATDVSIDIEDYIRISSSKALDRSQEVWKVVSTADGRANLRAEENSYDEDQVLQQHDDDTESEGTGSRVNPFRIMSYHVDFNGSTFLPVSSQFNIHPFKGYRDITSLSIYPLRFAQNRSELRSKWLARGKRFRELATPQHLYYEGRSITSRPNGYQAAEDYFPKYSGNIDSEVVVDFKEALSTHPNWKNAMPYFVTMKSILRREFSENFPIYYWSEGRRPEVVRKQLEYYYIDRRVDEKMMEVARGQDGLVKDIPDKALEEDWKLGDEHLILLPNRVYAFVMKFRKFGRFLASKILKHVARSLNVKQLLFPSMVSEQSTRTGMVSMTSSYRMDTKN